jgi:hypothetical protein
MVSISKRLKSLGVNLGSDTAPPAKRKGGYSIDKVVKGQLEETEFGEAFVVDEQFPVGEKHGDFGIDFPSQIDRLAIWAKDSSLVDKEREAFLFIDTETTGLAGGSSTFAFMIGTGRFHEDYFWQRQFFLRDPIEEPAMLAALESFAAPADSLVSFNGKSFDIPLLTTRFLTNAAPSPFGGMAHLDLLHMARRLWREVLVSRTLGNLEEAMLGVKRSSEDIAGWLIPEMYTDYLRSGDARALKGVFYHNALDIRSMVTLLGVIASKLEQPYDKGAPHGEMFAIARLFADLGYPEDAIDLYSRLLELTPHKEIKSRLIQNLAWLHRQREDFDTALPLWELAADEGEVYAYIEIAKYYEHQSADFDTAIRYSKKAMKIVGSKRASRFERVHWQPQLEHRLGRLESKQDNKIK